ATRAAAIARSSAVQTAAPVARAATRRLRRRKLRRPCRAATTRIRSRVSSARRPRKRKIRSCARRFGTNTTSTRRSSRASRRSRDREETPMWRVGCLVIIAGGLLAGCTSSEVLVAHSVPLSATKEEIPENQLLDVGVAVFDPGVPAGEVDKKVLE